jgi:hypothetical protein
VIAGTSFAFYDAAARFQLPLRAFVMVQARRRAPGRCRVNSSAAAFHPRAAARETSSAANLAAVRMLIL